MSEEEARHLSAYLLEVDQLVSVSAEEERNLVANMRNGDDSARHRVIEAHLKEVASIALDACPDGMRPLDAIQEANVVLIRLVETPADEPLDRTSLREEIRRHLKDLV